MSDLQTLQRALQTQILCGDGVLSLQQASDVAIGAPRRVQIYASAYRLRLLEALQTDYTALHTALGDDAFQDLALAYIAAHPSHQANLRWFGANLSHFLSHRAPYAAKPVLSELAEFEWTMGLAFDAPDQACLTINDLAAVPAASWAEMRFEISSSAHCLALLSNAASIGKAVSEEQTPPSPVYAETPVTWLIWRKDLSVFFKSMPEDETWALARLREGDSFAQICEGLCVWVDENQAPARAASLLKTWVDNQLIQRMYLSSIIAAQN